MDFYHSFLHQLMIWQYEINKFIASTIENLNSNHNYLLVILIAFLYGLIHAAGPGHGKALVSFYFINSNEKDYKRAFKMGFLISTIHAASALIVTFVLYFIIKAMFQSHFAKLSNIAMQISGVLIILIGIYLIYEAIKNRNKKEVIKVDKKSDFLVALSVGVVPCPGVMSIVLFSVLLNHFLLGVLSAIAMSIGMGITISLSGILTVLFRNQATKVFDKKGFYFEIVGAFLIILLGSFLLYSSFNTKTIFM